MVVLSLQSLLTRLTGTRLSLPWLQQLIPEDAQAPVPFPEPVQAVARSLTVPQCLEQEVRTIEDHVLETGWPHMGYALL